MFDALADETRRLIVDELVANERLTLFEICTRLATSHQITSSRQAISQHLDVLTAAGLLEITRVGRTKVHRLHRERLRSALSRWDLD